MKKTITIFGDSIAKGMKLDNLKPVMLKKNAVDLIKQKLNVEIDNQSMFGQTLKRIYQKGYIQKYLGKIDKSNRNILIIELGGNDSDYNWLQVADNCQSFNEPKTTEKEFQKILNEIILQLKENNVEVMFVTLPPINSVNYFNNVISKMTDGKKIMEFFQGDITNIERYQDLYNSIIIKTAIKNHCKIIDIRSCFLRTKNVLSLFASDGIHPNDEGQEFIARNIEKILAKAENM